MGTKLETKTAAHNLDDVPQHQTLDDRSADTEFTKRARPMASRRDIEFGHVLKAFKHGDSKPVGNSLDTILASIKGSLDIPYQGGVF
ncbi:uncharacterized protein BCR38DRAFT_442228 [Pseudomassariella vexata]|uniref:Uncharacterized protein n=1 Tax=Pseudomassariella vexata TaxID=1141098 RepID=A0A1Y2DN27_9PEZI|nr:uncharacterized protein BCR38DRAFT_442228 [Pseudomassariella vexata]ORY60698.1 hypothetical protein BCR38DRAFT_442228 [Pseudomassariella vexata]